MQSENEKPYVDESQHNEPDGTQTANAGAAQDPVMELPEIPGPPPAYPSVYVDPQSSEPRRRSSGWKSFAAAVALVAVGAGIGGAATWGLAKRYIDARLPIGYRANTTGGAQTIAALPQAGGNVIPEIYRRVSPAVVSINVNINRGWQRGQASGSGFVVDSQGFILTNNHVIDGGTDITVKFVDGTTLRGTVVGADARKDLAVIKVDPGNRPLVAVPLGDSDKVQVGELAIAIGSPFDQEFTVTAGIVSAIDRELQEENNPWTILGGIQTDAAINPGNSGGPLLNGNGEVIGINTLIETGDSGLRANVGIGFAVPVNAAKEILPQLMAGEQVQYAFLGVTPATLTKQIAQQFKVDAEEGVVVVDVAPDSPADQAGLQPGRVSQTGAIRQIGDVIVAIDGKSMKTADDLYRFIQSKKVGDVINLTVVRGSRTETLSVTLAARPKDE